MTKIESQRVKCPEIQVYAINHMNPKLQELKHVRKLKVENKDFFGRSPGGS